MKSLILAFFVLATIGAGGGALPLSAIQRRDEAPYSISVDVDLVVLHATVTSGRGAPVSGLEEKDFQVYEDGVPQHIILFVPRIANQAHEALRLEVARWRAKAFAATSMGWRGRLAWAVQGLRHRRAKLPFKRFASQAK